MTDNLAGRYQITELVAVAWNDDMAARFPNADHHGCRQEMQPGPLIQHRPFEKPYRNWVPFNPPQCHGWHCNRCGAPTNSMGHHNCPDRPTT
jgi:hypothetical protein